VRRLLGVVPIRVLREIIEAIHAADAARVLEQVSQLAAEGYELGHFCGEFTCFVRDLMIAKSCGSASPLLQVPQDERQILAELSLLFSEEDLTRFFQILLRTEGELRYSLQPRFHLELGLMKLVHARRLVSLESLLAPLVGGETVAKSGSNRPVSTAAAPVGGVKVTPATTDGELKKLGEEPAPPRLPPVQSPEFVSTSQPAISPGVTRQAPVDDRLAAIKALVFHQSKFLGSCLEPMVGWRFENGEVRFLYSRKDSWAADALQSREQQDKLRSACAQVLGEPVRIYVTLQEQEREGRSERPGARERARRDPRVEAFRKKFDCAWVDVKDLSQE
jgi:DNA polymerase III gamma/tau subunit